MKKLIIAATALALMMPSPILALEENGIEEPMQEEIEMSTSEVETHREIPDGLSEEEFIFFQSYFKFRFFDVTTNEFVDHFSYRPEWGSKEDVAYPVTSESYQLSFPLEILKNYTFTNALPDLNESQFTMDHSENDILESDIIIEVIPREKDSKVNVLNSNLPIILSYTYTYKNPLEDCEYDVEKQITFSSGQEVGLALENSTVTIDSNLFETALAFQNPTIPYKLDTNTFDSEKLLPIKAGDQTLFYYLEVSLREGTYEEIESSTKNIRFVQKDDKYGKFVDCTIPFNILCPEKPQGKTFTLNNEDAQRISDYINQNDLLSYNLWDYLFSFEVVNPSKTYDISASEYIIEADAKIACDKESSITTFLTIEDRPDLKDTLDADAHYLTGVENLTDDNLYLSMDKLQNFVKELYADFTIDTDKLSSFDFNTPQPLWSHYNEKLDHFNFNFEIPLKPLSDETRDNTEFALRFYDDVLDRNVGVTDEVLWDGCVGSRPWKDWFKDSSLVGDTLTSDNIDQAILKKLPEEFKISDPNFELSFYSFGNAKIDVESKTGYFMDQVTIEDWGESLDGERRFFLYLHGYEIWNYDVDLSYSTSGKLIGTFTGKDGFSGTKVYEFTDDLIYVIRFSTPSPYGWTNPIKDLVLEETNGTLIPAVSDYLKQIPDGYSYASKPTELAISDFTQPVYGNRRQRRTEIEMVETPKNVQWKFDDQDVKILIPYVTSDRKFGTLSFSKSDLNSDLKTISKDKINSKLLGYEYAHDIDLSQYSSTAEVVGYKNGNSFSALEYKLKDSITVDTKSTSNTTPNENKVSVSLAGGKIEVDLTHFETSENSFKVNTANLKTALEDAIKEIAQKVIEEIKPILPSLPSQPDGSDSKVDFLPDYVLIVPAFEDHELTSTDLDISKGSTESDSEIKVAVKENSYIRLRFVNTPKVESAQVRSMALPKVMSLSLNEERTTENSEISLFSFMSDLVEVKSETSTLEATDFAIVSVNKVTTDNQLTADTIKSYLTEQNIGKEFNEDFEEYFKTIDFNQPQSFSMINPETGYLEIQVPVVGEVTSLPEETPTPEDPEPVTPSNPSTGGGGGGGSKPTPKPEETKPEAPEETIPSTSTSVGKKVLFRFYNTLTGEHFFTSDEKEKNDLLANSAWKAEGHGWTTPEHSDYPIYRLCNPNNGDHHYTLDKNEYDTLQTLGWVGEGVGLYSAGETEEGIVQLYRLYNPNEKGAGAHHYTADENEKDTLVKLGWNYEGIAWHGLEQE